MNRNEKMRHRTVKNIALYRNNNNNNNNNNKCTRESWKSCYDLRRCKNTKSFTIHTIHPLLLEWQGPEG